MHSSATTTAIPNFRTFSSLYKDPLCPSLVVPYYHPQLALMVFKDHYFIFLLQDGIVNPTVRKDLKTVPKFYCCPIEGCPRGPDRPFSQFSLVKQVFYLS